MIKKKGQTIRLDTPNTTMILKADTAEYLYYGQRLVSNGDPASIPGSGCYFLSTFGSDDYSEYSLLMQGGGFAADFQFAKARVLASKPELPGLPSSYGEGKTVELKYTDAAARLVLFLYFTAYEDCDVIAISARIVNGSRKEVRIRRMMSLQLDLAETGLEFVTFSWPRGSECRRSARRVDSGVFINDSKSGSLHAASPFVLAEGKFGVYGADLVYSGNHKEVLAVGRGRSRLLVGLNDFAFGWTLQPGESFCSPEAVVCFAPEEDSLCSRMQAFVGGHISGGKWKKRERPVVFEIAEPHVSADTIDPLAEAAKRAGAELLLLSSGSCADVPSADTAADVPSAETGAALAEKLREKGLGFGIRIEPETVAEDSDLCRTRPQYLMKIPGRRPVCIRGRLMLNLADEKVQNYAVRAACEAIERGGASYVRWDCCRTMTDCFGKGVLASEYFHRYILGYYRVLSKVVKRFPFILFEGSAAGGGRLDLGNLCYFSQYSSCGDERTGCPSLSGPFCAYPQTTICTKVPFADRAAADEDFFTASCGLLAYVWKEPPGEEVCAHIARQVGFYKDNRKLLQFGEQICLSGSGAHGLMTVSKDRANAIAVLFFSGCSASDPPARIRFKELLPSAVYEVSAYGDDSFHCTIGGDLLMGQWIGAPFVPAQDGADGAAFVRMFLFRKKRSS